MDNQTQHVTELALGVLPRPDVPRPALLQSEQHCILLFEAQAVTPPHQENVAVITFRLCRCVRFGYPNDEALGGHPLYALGLRHYAGFEVVNSAWDRELRSQNLAVFSTYELPRRRHFVFTFKDSTFECLADSIEVGTTADSLSGAIRRLSQSLAHDA